MGLLLELVQISLDGILSFRFASHATQLNVVCRLSEGALNPTVYATDEDITQYWTSTTCNETSTAVIVFQYLFNLKLNKSKAFKPQ